MSNDDKNSESESNVWASYSDLFTNVAIIFLVMFVFALIKATMSQVKNVQTKIQHENELKAKMSQKEIQKGKERVAKVEKAVEEMREYENIIDKKVQELNTYAKKLQSNKQVLKEMIESQAKQDSMMKAAEEKLMAKQLEVKLKEQELAENQKRIQELNDEVNRIHQDSVLREDNLRRSIASESETVELTKKQLEKVKKEMALKEEKIIQDAALKQKEFEQQLTIKQKQTEEVSSQKQKQLEQQLALKEKQIQDDLLVKQKDLEGQIASMVKKLSDAQSESQKMENALKQEKVYKAGQEKVVNDLRSQLAGIENELMKNREAAGKLAGQKSELDSKLADIGNQRDALKKSYDSLEKQYQGAAADNKSLSEKLAELGSKSSQAEKSANKWKDQFEKQVADLDKLKSQLNESNARFRQLADTMTKLKDSVKNGVALKLQDKFKENGLDAKVDLKTGEVVLLSGEGFNFEKGSARLSKEAKLILKKIIPIYSEVLLGDNKIYSQIDTINMEGHSSPSFGGKYVPPTEKNPEAYSFNMRLSAMRASSVASYLMSKEIGEYPNKEKMKLLLQSVGLAYMKPVAPSPMVRGPASVQVENSNVGQCGPFDCYKSQRVQINFLLKDNMEEIKKIIDANGDIR